MKQYDRRKRIIEKARELHKLSAHCTKCQKPIKGISNAICVSCLMAHRSLVKELQTMRQETLESLDVPNTSNINKSIKSANGGFRIIRGRRSIG